MSSRSSRVHGIRLHGTGFGDKTNESNQNWFMLVLTEDSNDKILHPKGCGRLYGCLIRPVCGLSTPIGNTKPHNETTDNLLEVLGFAYGCEVHDMKTYSAINF